MPGIDRAHGVGTGAGDTEADLPWIYRWDEAGSDEVMILTGMSDGFGRYIMGGHMEASHNTVETRVGRGSLENIVIHIDSGGGRRIYIYQDNQS